MINNNETSIRKKSKAKTGIKISSAILAIILLWLVLASILPLLNHKEVSQDYQASFHPADCYSDTPGTERVACIDDNKEALLCRLMLIENAKEEILLSTFDMKEDESGKDIMAALLQAADRGVQIKLLVDHATSVAHLSKSDCFKVLALHPNIEIKRYNPVQLFLPYKALLRLHDKTLVIDQTAYLLGGRNTYDLFLGDYSEIKNIDRELLVYQTEQDEHSSMTQLRDYFSEIWSLDCCKPYTIKKETDKMKNAKESLFARYEQIREAYAPAFTAPDWEAITMPANKITLLANPPEAVNKEPELWYSMVELMSQGEQIVCITPYIICSKRMYKDLTNLCRDNKEVAIITNAAESGANPFGCSDYLNQKKKIWQTGVDVYEFSGQHSLHTKTILIDQRMSIVGSFNMDMRSAYLDTELMLAVDCEALNKQLRDSAEEKIQASRLMNDDGQYEYGPLFQERTLSVSDKIKYTLLRILSPLIRHLL
ncbi:MAG: phospholipase D family protein [Clostridiales bacterium]|nr:phospholipase D family protein [Clostridiales bacterium]